MFLSMDIFQTVKIHDCVGCHYKGNPKMMVEYEIKNLIENKNITFLFTLYKEDKDKVFTGESLEEKTEITIENPIVSHQI